ncbi:MAG: protein kinase [Deltaproteobacteria bacterium]|nr:protein kinase [Deltaproteobacteria bacterium]
MQKLMEIWSQKQGAVAIGGVLLLLLILFVLRAGKKKYGKKTDPKLADDLAKGNYEAAAERELKAGRLRSAYDLFLRAQQPMRAAQIAVRQGRLQDAAELFEKAGSRKRAADLYKQVGMKLKAEELLAEDERAAREREAQRAALRKRLQDEPEDEDVARLDLPPPAAKTPPPKPEALDLGDVAQPAPAGDLDLGAAAKPETPSLFGIQALLDKAAEKAASQAVALAATQASMATFAAAFEKSIVARGVEQEDLALRYAADSAVSAAREGPSVEDLQQALAARGNEAGAEDIAYQLGLALVAAGRWSEAREAFVRVEKAAPGHRDAAARAQELARWQGVVGETSFSSSKADGRATRYTLLGELGRGGMAVVYRARDEALGREVALKFMAEGMGNDPAAVALFQREARAVAQLSHRNIVTLYDVGEQDGKAFICMELVDGNTVEKTIEKEGKLEPAKAAAVVGQVLDALEMAHGKQTIHRDIKPANIMLARDGTVKVMDFGLAKRVEGPDKTTMIAGSPPYMAPEQFVGKNMDGRTDLFALAASFYEMLTGQPPFPGMARFEPPPSMRTLDPGIPVALDGIVMRALEFDKEKRFAGASEMAQALRAFLAGVGPVQLGGPTVARPAGGPVPEIPVVPTPEPSPSVRDLPIEEGRPAAAELSLDEVKPAAEELSFGEARPAAEVQFALDSEDSGAVVSPPVVEGLPEAPARSTRATPRTPVPAVGSSAGAYRMVRPSQPDVFTPAPSVRVGSKTPTPRPRSRSGEHPSGPARPTTARTALSLAPRAGRAEQTPRPADRAPGGTRLDASGLGSRPTTPSPAPRTGPEGTVLGIGPGRTGK